MTTTIVLTADGVSLMMRVDGDRLPRVIHWGAELGELSQQDADTLARGEELPIMGSQPDVPLRYSVLIEGRDGVMVRPGLIGSRDGEAWSPDWRVTSITADDAEIAGVYQSGPARIRFEATASESNLGLTLEIELTPQGLVGARASVHNFDESAFQVDELTLAMPVPSRAAEVLDFAGRWGVERFPQRSPMTVGLHRREGRSGRTGADAAYVLHLGVPGFGYRHGEVWTVHTAWSGNHIHQAQLDLSGTQVISGGEQLLAGEVRLARDESYTSPWLYFAYGDGLDDVARRHHLLVRSFPHAPDFSRPVTLNVWEAVYFDHNLARLTDLAERAAKLGVERFVLDDGWFGGRRNERAGLGDWVVSPEAWPDGLHPLVDRVHELGMEFGLWFEPEMVNEDSDVARAHPEWIMQPKGRRPVEARHQQVINLSIDAAWDHVFTQVNAVLDDHRIDYVKWDHNRDLVDAGNALTGTPAVHAQTLAFYRLLDALREAHPEVEFESCSSGGARVDLEVLKRVERVWVSDVSDPAERQRMLWWTSQLVPAEFQGSHVASGLSHTTGRWHDLTFRAATAVFGHFGIEWDLAEAKEDELAELGWWIDWYRSNRDVLLGGTLVRIDMPHPDVYFKGMIAQRAAIFSLSQLRVSPVGNLGMIRFPGLDSAARYRVTVIDRQPIPEAGRPRWEAEPIELTGRLLGEVGLRAPQLLPESVVLFHLERL